MNGDIREMRLMISNQQILIAEQKRMIKILQDIVEKKTEEITVSCKKIIYIFKAIFQDLSQQIDREISVKRNSKKKWPKIGPIVIDDDEEEGPRK